MDKGKIILLSLAHMCSDINGGAIPALLPFLVVAFGYSYTDAAVIIRLRLRGFPRTALLRLAF